MKIKKLTKYIGKNNNKNYYKMKIEQTDKLKKTKKLIRIQ